MSILKIVKLFILCRIVLLSPEVYCIISDFYSGELCERKNVTSCSFQIQSLKNKCDIYNTSVCRTFNFSEWSDAPYMYPSSELETSFRISIVPYAGKYITEQSLLVSAVNITLSSFRKGINGYILNIVEAVAVNNISICRIFDFREAEYTDHVELFYDCIHSLVEKGVQNFLFYFRALPINEEIKYSVFIPDYHEIETRNICQWKPVVMIFLQSLQQNNAEVKFSQADASLNVSAYKVTLMSDHNVIRIKLIYPSVKDRMLHTIFTHIDKGYYTIKVTPVLHNVICGGKESVTFFVENKIIDAVTIISILCILVTGVVIILIYQWFLRWLLKPGTLLNNPTVLVVHSDDCEQHTKVVIQFIEFLNSCANINAISIYGPGTEDPNKWLVENYKKASTILIVISSGVFHKIERQNNPPLKEQHIWGDRFTLAFSLILREMFRTKEKKFVEVFFEYSGRHHIPKYLKLKMWKTFTLVKDMNKLLCYLHNQVPKMNCVKIYPLMPGHNLTSTKEGIALFNAINEMKTVAQNCEHNYHIVEAKSECIEEKKLLLKHKNSFSESECATVQNVNNEIQYEKIEAANIDMVYLNKLCSIKNENLLNQDDNLNDFWQDILNNEAFVDHKQEDEIKDTVNGKQMPIFIKNENNSENLSKDVIQTNNIS